MVSNRTTAIDEGGRARGSGDGGSMASRFLPGGAAALSARGHRRLAGQMCTPPLAGPASTALAGQGLRHHSASSSRHHHRPSSIPEVYEAMANMERRLDALEAGNSSNPTSAATKSSSWVPPEAGWVKLNVGALLAREFGEATTTTGVVVRDELGGVVLSATRKLPACSSEGEALLLAGYKEGLELLLKYEQAMTRVVLESDSAACIDALTRTCRDPSGLPAINREVMKLKEGFEELRFV